jgi:hypothetical protein
VHVLVYHESVHVYIWQEAPYMHLPNLCPNLHVLMVFGHRMYTYKPTQAACN